MRVLVERTCGLDVHQAVIVAYLLVGKAAGKVHKEVRSFASTTAGLLALRDWLKAAGCTHVGMESTGVYWQPVYAILEDQFDVVVGNAQRIKNVPGRKTHVKDAEWIAELVRYGLIPPSFVPARPLRVLRDLLRDRRSLVEARSNCRNRVLKVLERANIKLASVASDVFGVSGRRRWSQAPRHRPRSPTWPAESGGRSWFSSNSPSPCRATWARSTASCCSTPSTRRIAASPHREADWAQTGAYRKQHRLLTTIPGIDWALAATMIAEHGVDMTRFGTAGRFAAWSGVAPGNNESAGKHHRSGARKGNPHLKTPPRSAPRAPRTPTCATNTIASRRVADPAAPRGPSPTRSPSPLFTSSRPASPIVISAATISTNAASTAPSSA
jgi:transposase